MIFINSHFTNFLKFEIKPIHFIVSGRLKISDSNYIQKAQDVGEKSIQTEKTERYTINTSSQTVLFGIPLKKNSNSEKDLLLTQIDASSLDYEPETEDGTTPRSIEECHTIYKEEVSNRINSIFDIQ